jgi:Cu-processing system ATP-binding protein
MINIEHLSKAFGKNEVIKDLSVTINRGRIAAILGPNGSGKTTLIKCILGLVVPDTGNISIAGEPVLKQWHYRKNIGYLPQIARFPEHLKVDELIKMVKNLRNLPGNDQELIELFGLEPFLYKQLGNLSGGTRQKVNIVLGFMFDSPLLILDEPTVGLDPIALIKLKELIAREKTKGKTILFTTHIMTLVEEIAEDIVFILEGKPFFSGKLQEIQTQRNEQNLEKLIAGILAETDVTV